MADDRARIIAWIEGNPNGGNKKCAAALGLDVDLVASVRKEHRGSGSVMSLPARAREEAPPPAPLPAHQPPPPTHRPPVHASRLGRLEWQLDTALGDLEELQKQEKASTALSSLHNTIAKIGDDLDLERERVAKDPEREMSEAELVDTIVGAIEHLSPDAFDRVAEVVDHRRGGLRVVGA